jgi:hypothetical protein
MTNGDPSAILIVTPRGAYRGDGMLFNKDSIYVAFDDPSGKWVILNQNGAPMPIGTSFNVLVVKA